jgi:hypothetical protein
VQSTSISLLNLGAPIVFNFGDDGTSKRSMTLSLPVSMEYTSYKVPVGECSYFDFYAIVYRLEKAMLIARTIAVSSMKPIGKSDSFQEETKIRTLKAFRNGIAPALPRFDSYASGRIATGEKSIRQVALID